MQETQDEKLWDELTGQDEKKQIEQEQKQLKRHLQESMLDEWEELTGYDATQDSFFDWNNDDFWLDLSHAIIKAKSCQSK